MCKRCECDDSEEFECTPGGCCSEQISKCHGTQDSEEAEADN